EDVLARHVANQLGVQDAHMALRVPPELVVVVALDDIPAHADDPQRHRQPPGQPAAIFTRGRAGRKDGTSTNHAEAALPVQASRPTSSTPSRPPPASTHPDPDDLGAATHGFRLAVHGAYSAIGRHAGPNIGSRSVT